MCSLRRYLYKIECIYLNYNIHIYSEQSDTHFLLKKYIFITILILKVSTNSHTIIILFYIINETQTKTKRASLIVWMPPLMVIPVSSQFFFSSTSSPSVAVTWSWSLIKNKKRLKWLKVIFIGERKFFAKI